jgi:hypothetical protein
MLVCMGLKCPKFENGRELDGSMDDLVKLDGPLRVLGIYDMVILLYNVFRFF